ncbi:MAG: phospho-N-acetylmuramoyl-pentapeptide-transferase, partial [bacterium]
MNSDLYSAIYAILVAFIINIALCPVIIPFLTKLKFGQNVRDDGPKSHLVKSGTPTMGGVMILISLVVTSILFLNNNNNLNTDSLAVLFVTIGYAIIGFIDDYIKVVKKRSLGLKAMQKIIGQLIITCCFLYYLFEFKNLGTDIFIPFSAGKTLDLGILFIPFFFIAMIGTVNGVNLTDGLDGLATGVTVLVVIFFLFMSLELNTNLTHILGAGVGALLGFLLFNTHPAKVFMGDTGSLALGGFVASIAMIMKMPLFIVIVGIIYVLESISVILQVGYFKMTNGKRLFKMAPLHHHYEQCGWKEVKVVSVFYIVTAIACLIGFLA